MPRTIGEFSDFFNKSYAFTVTVTAARESETILPAF